MKGIKFMGFKDIVNKNELRFVNREAITNNTKAYYQSMMNEKPFFKILSVSGMGGIGKSRLLNELKFVLKKHIVQILIKEYFFLH